MGNKRKKLKIRLEAVLKEKGWTKYKFAKALNKSTSNVAVYFKEDYNPNLSTLAQWAEVLNCKVKDLLDE